MTESQPPSEGANRQALLEMLLKEEGIGRSDSTSIPRQDDGDSAVLSFAQERLWFLEQLESDTAALSVRAAVRIRGHLNVDALRRGLETIVKRHETLHTLIANVGGQPVFTVMSDFELPYSFLDLGSALDRNEQLAAVLKQEAERTFALQRDLPVFIRIIRMAEDDHVLSVVIHHVAADGWSFAILFKELTQLYEAYVAGEPSPLPDLPIRYQDYAAWQRNWVRGDLLTKQMAYWSEQLGGQLPNFELPTDFRRPAKQTYEGGQVHVQLSADLTSSLRQLSRSSNATMFMTMLAAFELVTARRAGADEVVIGTPVAGRVRPELESMIGMFLNTLVLRTKLDDNPTFDEFLARVRDTSLGAFDNQDLPFEHLLAELHPTRDLSRTPLFQVFFNMMNFEIDPQAGAIPGLSFEVLDQPELGSKFDLTLYVDEHDQAADLLLVYNRALYRHDTMRQLMEQYVSVLGAVVENPTKRISEYSLVTPEARSLLPNPTLPLDATWHGSVHGAVRRQARRVPDQVAVIDKSSCWSFAVLAACMNRLAYWLISRGISKGDIVAVYGARNATLVHVVTGVLAAGAAYVILNPRYPPRRLAQYISIAKPKAWLALNDAGDVPPEVVEELDRLGVGTRLALPNLSALDDLAELQGLADVPLDEDDDAGIGPDDLACLTFTSGSTGDPKAVLGRHGSLTHFLPWMSQEFGVDEKDRFSMLSGLSHDPIQRDMFWPLWLGATLIVPDPDEMESPGWIANWMREESITVAHLTPAMGQLVTETVGARALTTVPSLRLALYIGDILSHRDVERLRELAPNVKVINLYGTTETQRASGYYDVAQTDAAGDSGQQPLEVLPLGVGMPGVQLLVRGEAGESAGFGEVGEIWFRSHHLALGYLNSNGDSQSRFLSNSLSEDPGDRLYRTGDRGSYRSDGVLQFRGRGDQQVKIRGFRIELGEVQAVLGRHPDVREAIVQVEASRDQFGQLVAYVVPESGRRLDISDLAKSMREELPAPMVPVSFVTLDRIPLTPNGKLDRSALPRPIETVQAETNDEPRDELEQMLTDIWKTVLGKPSVGIHDNFFDLGGYSLLATRVFAMLESRTGKRLPISLLFETPTIAELAQSVRNDTWHSEWTSMVPIQPAGSKTPFFYVAPYLISVLQFANLGVELGYDQPLYGFQPQGLDGQRPVHQTIEEMAAHYIDEMKSVQPHGPYMVGGHCSGAWVAFEMARQLEAQGDELHSVVLVDQGPPAVERPAIRPLRYILNRLHFYFRDGRLGHAVSWRLKIDFARFFLRQLGSPATRYVEEVRETHRRAYRKYEGGRIKHDIFLIRSAESLALSDKVWYLRWSDQTDGSFHSENVPGTHANLLERPYVVELAKKLKKAFDLEREHGA